MKGSKSASEGDVADRISADGSGSGFVRPGGTETLAGKPSNRSPAGPTVLAGRFELLLELNRGGMATLFLARMRGPETFQKLVAIKRIHEHLADEEEFVNMFLDEARIAARIQHPNVASIYDLGQDGDTYFIAMEYVHGESWRDILRASVRTRTLLDWAVAARVVADAAYGLHAAHELRTEDGEFLGVVHRDVSPQNILVSYEGHVKVIDFGVAFARERITHTQDGSVKGKVAYMSPEQVAGQTVDRRSDIFSLGIVLWESLCLRRLFKRDNAAATMRAITQDAALPPSSLRPGLPPELDSIVLKALAKESQARYPTAQALAEDLERMLAAYQKVVTQSTLGRIVSGLFAERKAQKEAEIREALRRPAPRPTKSHEAFAAPGSSTSLTAHGLSDHAAAGTLPAGPRRKGLLLGLVAGGVALAATGGLAWWLSGRREAPRARPEQPRVSAPSPRGREVDAMAASRAPRPQPPEKVLIHIVVAPPVEGAVVTVGGEEYHGTDVTAAVPKSDQPMKVLVRAPGFQERRLLVVPLKDVERKVELRKRMARPRRRPVRESPERWYKQDL